LVFCECTELELQNIREAEIRRRELNEEDWMIDGLQENEDKI